MEIGLRHFLGISLAGPAAFLSELWWRANGNMALDLNEALFYSRGYTLFSLPSH